jgi:hypothetical protein
MRRRTLFVLRSRAVLQNKKGDESPEGRKGWHDGEPNGRQKKEDEGAHLSEPIPLPQTPPISLLLQ